MKTYDELSEENDRLHSELQLEKLAKLEIRQLHQDAKRDADESLGVLRGVRDAVGGEPGEEIVASCQRLRREHQAALDDIDERQQHEDEIVVALGSKGLVWADIVPEIARLRRELAAYKDAPLPTLCAECGPGVRTDEDGLCATCGAVAFPAEEAYAEMRRELAEARENFRALSDGDARNGETIERLRRELAVQREGRLDDATRLGEVIRERAEERGRLVGAWELVAEMHDFRTAVESKRVFDWLMDNAPTPPAGEGSPPVGAYVCDDFSPSRFSDTACGRCGMPKGDHAAPPAGGAEEWDAMRLDLLRSLPQRYFELASSIVDRHDPRKGGRDDG